VDACKIDTLSSLRQFKHSILLVHHAKDDSACAKTFLTASQAEDWKRVPGVPRITWIKTFVDDRMSHSLTLTVWLRIDHSASQK